MLEADGTDEQVRQSPLATVRRKTQKPTLTPRHSERALLSESTSMNSERGSVGALGGLARWFRSTKDQSSVDVETGADLSSYTRKSSLSSQRGRNSDGIGRSFLRARHRVERRLGRLGIGKRKKKVGGIEEVPGSCKKSLFL